MPDKKKKLRKPSVSVEKKAGRLAQEVSEQKILRDIIGRTVGGSEIVSLIGTGGMGAVFKAVHKGIKRHVAVKILPKSFSPDPERVRRFFREAESLGQIRHPNIVEIYNVGEEETLYFIEMEYLEGEDLADRLADEKPLPTDEAHRIMTEICLGLAKAHECSIVHRDLKPANILLTREGSVKIVDFGVAKNLEGEDDLTAHGTILGTPQYMSPEQCRGLSLDTRSDIYSLGALFYTMLTGRPPFKAPEPMAVLIKHMREDILPPTRYNASLDPSYNAIVECMMAKDPAERYASVSEVLLRLEDIREGRTVTYTSRRTRRRRAMALFSVVAAVGAAVLVIALAVQKEPAPKPQDPAHKDQAFREAKRLWRLGSLADAREAFSRIKDDSPRADEAARLQKKVQAALRARKLEEAGELASARKTLEAAFGPGLGAQGGPHAPEVVIDLARAIEARKAYRDLLANADFPAARAALRAARALRPDDKKLAKDAVVLDAVQAADRSLHEGDPIGALQGFSRQALDARWKGLLGGHISRAASACLTRALSLPDSEAAMDLLLAVVKIMPGHAGAAEALEQTRGKINREKRFKAFLRQGEEALGKGDFDRAIALFGRASEWKTTPLLERRIAEAEVGRLEARADAFLKTGKNEEALSALAKAAQKAAAGRRESIDERIRALRATVKEGFLRRIRKALASGDVKDALTTLDKSTALFPKDPAFTVWAAELRRVEGTPKGTVYVRGRSYPVGHEGEKENLPRRVTLAPFYISRYEVSNRLFADFVKAGGYRKKEYWHPKGWVRVAEFLQSDKSHRGPGGWLDGVCPAGEADHPVTAVCWYEADAYARFRGMRLPLEIEWEVAASYDPALDRARAYPWGDFWVKGAGAFFEGGEPAPVPVHKAGKDVSPLGCVHMAGNVAEWTGSTWSKDGRLYVFRGTSVFYENPQAAARTYRRDQRSDPARLRVAEVGFRLAKSAD